MHVCTIVIIVRTSQPNQMEMKPERKERKERNQQQGNGSTYP